MLVPASKRVGAGLAVVLGLFIGTAGLAGADETAFPGDAWERRPPEALGLNVEAVEAMGALMEKARANGVLIRDGYLVAEWTYGGPADERFETQSCTKSITSMVLGLALKEGKIADLDDRVKDYYPSFDAGPYTDEITFWHLVTATSGIEAKRWTERYDARGDMEPGLAHRYHNDHTAELARALTYIFGEDLETVLRDRVLDPIGADMEWGSDGDRTVTLPDGSTVRVVAGFAFSRWTAQDLARVGWLHLNRGYWKGDEILAPEYVAKSMTPITVANREKEVNYGLAWRAGKTEDGRLYWYMSGNGGQFCVVLPELNVVMTKINRIGKDYQPFTGIEAFEEHLFRLVEPEGSAPADTSDVPAEAEPLPDANTGGTQVP